MIAAPDHLLSLPEWVALPEDMVDLGDPLSLGAYRLVDGRYQEAAAVTGMFETNEPFSLRVDVAALARRA
jgi:hypothetical protein